MARRYEIKTILSARNDAHKDFVKYRKDLKGLGGAASSAAATMKQKFANVGNIFTGVLAARAVSSSIAAITGGIQDVAQETIEFDTAMVKSGAKFKDMVGGNTEQFKKLQASAQEVGGTTEHTMTAAAQALEVYAKAGMKSEAAMGMLSGAANLATVAGVSMAEAADYSLGIFDSFNMRTNSAIHNQKKLAYVNNIMTRTITSAKLEMEDFNETIKYSGSVAALAKLPFEDLATVTGVMALANIRGTKAGTTMKNMLLRLAAPVGKGKKAIKKMGLEVYNTAGVMRPYIDIMADARQKFSRMTEKQRNFSMSVIFGKRAIAGATKVMAISESSFQKYRAEISRTDNDAQKMADTIRGSVGNQMAIVRSKIVSLGINTFMRFRGEILKTITVVGQWVQSIDPNVVVARIRAIANGFTTVVNVLQFLKPLIAGVMAMWAAHKVLSIVEGVGALAMQFGMVSKQIGIMGAVSKTFSAGNPWVLGLSMVAGLAGSLYIGLKNSRAEIQNMNSGDNFKKMTTGLDGVAVKAVETKESFAASLSFMQKMALLIDKYTGGEEAKITKEEAMGKGVAQQQYVDRLAAQGVSRADAMKQYYKVAEGADEKGSMMRMGMGSGTIEEYIFDWISSIGGGAQAGRQAEMQDQTRAPITFAPIELRLGDGLVATAGSGGDVPVITPGGGLVGAQ